MDAYNDYNSDSPSDAEVLAEWRDTLAHLEAGDMGYGAPWLTLDEAIAQAKAHIAALETK